MTGRLVIMGSGETAPTMVGTHREALERVGASQVVVLDTPFAFQENVESLTAKLVEFFDVSLRTTATVASLRTVEAEALEVERFRLALREAAAVFAGPGSPSYALKVWHQHDVGGLLTDVVLRGGSLTMASAAALTLGARTIPVYEMYKVGEDPHWLEGLDVMGRLGVPCIVVPHWNNAEGGDHDTSRCFIGQRRLGILTEGLDTGVLGVDEHTAATIDFDEGRLVVSGKGTVTLRGSSERILSSGESIDLSRLQELLAVDGSPAAPPPADHSAEEDTFDRSLDEADADGMVRAMLAVEESVEGDPSLHRELRSMIVQLGAAARQGLVDPRTVVGGFVELLLELRRDAREARRYDESDRIRDGLAELGVEVRDTPVGPEWELGTDQKP